jgi:hypothetical protein
VDAGLRFNWKTSSWAPDTGEQAERWIEALESHGIETVAVAVARIVPRRLAGRRLAGRRDA